MASSSIKFKSRDDWKKQKELEEARKAGTAPAEVDEEGREINPHIPQYIAQAPWYYGTSQATLKHQRQLNKKEQDGGVPMNQWYARGARLGEAAKKYRKGACINCGSMTHQQRDCFERPRTKGARFTNSNIAPDDVLPDKMTFDYEASHDRWNGYDPSRHDELIKQYNVVEEERRKSRADALNQKLSSIPSSNADESAASSSAAAAASSSSAAAASSKKIRSVFDDDDDDDDDDDNADGDDIDDDVRERGDENMQGSKVDGRTRTTIRNLRIREDTAKYLRNLDLDSAFYDPKTRSMRENPEPHKSDSVFIGDNQARRTGDAMRFNEIQRFSWDAAEKGEGIHMQAMPSQVEMMHREFQQKKELLKKQQKQRILDAYGGEEHLKAPPKELLYGQTEVYVEYAPDGRVLKGDVAIKRSKWDEDVYLSNHTSVWGSYWRDGQWGFACCHQFIKNSYCTGEAGKAAAAASIDAMRERQQKISSTSTLASDENKLAAAAAAASSARRTQYGENTDEPEIDPKELKRALKREAKRLRVSDDDDDRKRKYNSLSADTYEVSEAEVEAYRMKRQRLDDPMKDYINQA